MSEEKSIEALKKDSEGGQVVPFNGREKAGSVTMATFELGNLELFFF